MHKFRNKPGLKKARLSLESLLYLFACVKERKQCVCLKAHDRELQHRELIRLMAPVIMRVITWVDSHEVKRSGREWGAPSLPSFPVVPGCHAKFIENAPSVC